MKNQIIRTSVYVFIALCFITIGLESCAAAESKQCGSTDPDDMNVMGECVHGKGLYFPVSVVVPALDYVIDPMTVQRNDDPNVAIKDFPIPPIQRSKVITGARICVRSRYPEAKMSVSVQIRDGYTDEVYHMVVIDTWKGNPCSEAFSFSNPMHWQHKPYIRIKATNFNSFPQWASANVGVYAE